VVPVFVIVFISAIVLCNICGGVRVRAAVSVESVSWIVVSGSASRSPLLQYYTVRRLFMERMHRRSG